MHVNFSRPIPPNTEQRSEQAKTDVYFYHSSFRASAMSSAGIPVPPCNTIGPRAAADTDRRRLRTPGNSRLARYNHPTSDHRVAGSSHARCKSKISNDLHTVITSKIRAF